MAKKPALCVCYFSVQVWACLKKLYEVRVHWWNDTLVKIWNLITSVCRNIIRKGIAIKYKWHSHAKHIFLWSKSFYDRTRLILSPACTGKNKLWPLIAILISYIYHVTALKGIFGSCEILCSTVDFWPPLRQSLVTNIMNKHFQKTKFQLFLSFYRFMFYTFVKLVRITSKLLQYLCLHYVTIFKVLQLVSAAVWIRKHLKGYSLC